MRTYSVFLIACIMLMTTVGYATHAQDNRNGKRTLSVTGNGKADASPDIAYLTLSVETLAKAASQAVRDNSETTNKVIEVIKAKLGKNDKVSTAGYNLAPVYEYNNQTNKTEFKGYRASNRVIVEMHNLNEIGKIIDSAAQAGLNNIENLSFDTTKRNEYRRDALKAAVNDAKATAETLSKAAGVSLTKILQLSPTFDYPVPVYRNYALAKEAAAPAPPTPIEPGDISIGASVNIVFEIE
ncbi:MAG: SIMPL domain-containing protein [Thermodesulfobacteriota bacterium]